MKGTKFWQCFIYQNLFYILLVWGYAQTPRFMYFSWTEIFLPLCTIILCHVALSLSCKDPVQELWLTTNICTCFLFNTLLQPPVSKLSPDGIQKPILRVTTELVVAYWHWTLLVLHSPQGSVFERFIRNGRTYRQSNFQLCIINLANMLPSSEISL